MHSVLPLLSFVFAAAALLSRVQAVPPPSVQSFVSQVQQAHVGTIDYISWLSNYVVPALASQTTPAQTTTLFNQMILTTLSAPGSKQYTSQIYFTSALALTGADLVIASTLVYNNGAPKSPCVASVLTTDVFNGFTLCFRVNNAGDAVNGPSITVTPYFFVTNVLPNINSDPSYLLLQPDSVNLAPLNALVAPLLANVH
jgi:hypothetical protein